MLTVPSQFWASQVVLRDACGNTFEQFEGQSFKAPLCRTTVATSQCGNSMIFLLLKFSVKWISFSNQESNSTISEALVLLILEKFSPFMMGWYFITWKLRASKKVKTVSRLNRLAVQVPTFKTLLSFCFNSYCSIEQFDALFDMNNNNRTE